MKKRILSVFLVVVMLITMIPSFTISSFAATSGNFQYIVLEDGTASIRKYTGLETDLEIPSEIDGYIVTTIAAYAFDSCDSLTNIAIPDTVTIIGDRAFSGCSNLTNITVDSANEYYLSDEYGILFNKYKTELIEYPGGNIRTSYTIPNSVTTIGDGAFGSCSNLTSITISDSVTTIGEGAFGGCSNLTSITIPNGVEIIDDFTFNHCTRLQSVTLPDTVTLIGFSAFGDCTNLQNITIPNSVKTLAIGAIANCTSLESITIPESVTWIGPSAFEGCTSLQKISLPNSALSIMERAFYNTAFYNDELNWENGTLYIDNHLIEAKGTALTEFEIKEGTITIAESPFKDWINLKSIIIPNSIKLISFQAFFHCENLQNMYYNGTADDWVKISFGNDYHSNNPMEIAENVYFNGELVTDIVLSNDVTIINDYAFFGCSSLANITIPDSVTSVGISAFNGTAYYNDESNWVNDVLYIDNHLIEAKDTLLGEYAIKNGTITIAGRAFCDCKNLHNVSIPDSVIGVGVESFASCKNLHSLSLPHTIISIGDGAFVGCESLQSITIPNNIKIIGEHTFTYCSNLDSITIPKSVISISNCVFHDCKNLTNLYYMGTADSWTKIKFYLADCVMCGCSGLSNPMTYAQNIYFNGELVKDVVLTEDVTNINDYAFYGCESLTSITIPNTVTSIGSDAFTDCTSLTDVYFNGTEEQWDNIAIAPDNNFLTNANIHFIEFNGWIEENGKWAYYENGVKLTNVWKADSKGWCYLGEDGYMATNKWIADSKGWCYVGANGYCVTNQWVADSKGWCYLGADGRMVTNKWVKDSKGWCYVGANGYCVTNKWVADSKGWCYLGADGRMVTNKWVKDSKGWCYVGADGYCLTNAWKADSKGWCYLDANGRMVISNWVKDGDKWYYLDANGYMVTGTKTIGGKTYKFASNGVWIG